MSKLLALLFVLISPLVASDNQPGGFIGIAGLQHGRYQVDLAVPLVRVSSSSSGIHLGLAYRQVDEMDVLPVGKTQEFSHRGYQIGYFADLGRGVFVLGIERTETVDQTNYSNPDGFPLTRSTTTKGKGCYGKVGLRGEFFGIYAGYGTTSKFTAGLSFHF